MARTGRPKIEIEWETVEKLCGIQCTGEEIASILGIDYDTLNAAIFREYKSTFSDYYKKHSAEGRASLRRTQFKVAVEDEHPTMLIWLGKQHLGQKEPERNISEADDGLDWAAIAKVGAYLTEEVDSIKISRRTTPANNGKKKV